MVVVVVIYSRGAKCVTISAILSSLTSTVALTGVSRFLARCRIRLAFVAACVVFVSARNFTFSGNLATDFHSMVGCFTSCYDIFQFLGAAIALPFTQ